MSYQTAPSLSSPYHSQSHSTDNITPCESQWPPQNIQPLNIEKEFFDPCLLWPRPGQDELLSWNLSILCHSKKSWGKKTNCLLSKVLPEIASKGQKVEDSADRMRIFSNLFKVRNLTRRGRENRIKYLWKIQLSNTKQLPRNIKKSNSLRNGPPPKKLTGWHGSTP